MARGGKREGAGRRKGPASPARKITESIVRKAAAEGYTPLEFLLSVMRDETLDLDSRFEAAKAAAKFVHATKQETNHTGNVVFNVTGWEASIG
jgi:hypothetical protein